MERFSEKLRHLAMRLAEDAPLSATAVDWFSIFLQLGLHLPRFERAQAMQESTILAEGRRLALKLAADRRETARQVPPRWPDGRPLRGLGLSPLPDDIAKPILENYHYLRSFRRSSIHFGLGHPSMDWPYAILTLSPFDLDNIAKPGTEIAESTLVLSRVFAFPGTPRNAISFALSRLRNWLTGNRPDVRTILTYLNPNLGFSGASYAADNWELLGFENCTRYAYLNGDYITDRRFSEIYGTPPGSDAAAGFEGLSFSVWPLRPLRLLSRRIRPRDEPHRGRPHRYNRWSPPSHQSRAAQVSQCEGHKRAPRPPS